MTGTEKAAYYASSPRDALAHDLWDARKIYKEQGLYKEIRPKLREYSKYVQNEISDLFSKWHGGINERIIIKKIIWK